MTLNISQRAKFNKDYNIIEYIERDSNDNLLFLQRFNDAGLLTYQEEGDGKWLHKEYDMWGNMIFSTNDTGWYKRDKYHPPIYITNNCRYNWLMTTKISGDTEIHYDFFGKMIKVIIDDTHWSTIEHNYDNKYSTIYYSDGKCERINDFEPIDQYLYEYYLNHPELHIHNCVHDNPKPFNGKLNLFI